MSEAVLSTVSPVEALSTRIASRTEELTLLSAAFDEAYAIVTDRDRVNDAIVASQRPDLVLNDPVSMMVVPGVADLRRTNNFQPGMRSFGSRVYRTLDEPNFRGETQEWVGWAPITDEELDLYFFAGARGSYDEYGEFIEANNLDRDRIRDIELQSHVAKPAFMRMWIACPELTVALMRKCVDDREAYKEIGEELFVAYSLMSQLVDKNDPYVLRPELKGQVDEQGVDSWYLCR